MARNRRRKRNLQREREALNSPVRLDGHGEDPAIRALLTKLATATNAEAFEIALQLQKVYRGEAAHINDPALADEVNRLKQHYAEMDKDAKSWHEDRQRFVDDIADRAERKKPTGEKAERIKAKVGAEMEQAVTLARATRFTKQLELTRLAKDGPKELVKVTGTFENRGGELRLWPEVIKIMHLTFVYPPGEHLMPSFVADRYRQIQDSRRRSAAREKMLLANQDKQFDLSDNSPDPARWRQTELATF